MKLETKKHAQAIFDARLANVYGQIQAGHVPNLELIAAEAIEAALEFEHKCEQEKESEVVSRVVKLKRAHRKGVGMYARAEGAPQVADDADEFEREVLHGWEWAESQDKQARPQN